MLPEGLVFRVHKGVDQILRNVFIGDDRSVSAGKIQGVDFISHIVINGGLLIDQRIDVLCIDILDGGFFYDLLRVFIERENTGRSSQDQQEENQQNHFEDSVLFLLFATFVFFVPFLCVCVAHRNPFPLLYDHLTTLTQIITYLHAYAWTPARRRQV